jgi:hypothetical protein
MCWDASCVRPALSTTPTRAVPHRLRRRARPLSCSRGLGRSCFFHARSSARLHRQHHRVWGAWDRALREGDWPPGHAGGFHWRLRGGGTWLVLCRTRDKGQGAVSVWWPVCGCGHIRRFDVSRRQERPQPAPFVGRWGAFCESGAFHARRYTAGPLPRHGRGGHTYGPPHPSSGARGSSPLHRARGGYRGTAHETLLPTSSTSRSTR